MNRQEENNTDMTFEQWEAVSEAMERKRMDKNKRLRQKMARYYRKQRIYGGVMVVLGVIGIVLGYMSRIDGIGCLSLLMGAVGLWVMLTREMVIVDEFFLEYRDAIGM